MTLKYLIQKEFIQIRRNAFLPKLIFIFPIVIMCVMPWVMDMEIRNIVVDVVDNDRSTTSRRLVHRIEASDYFIFNGQKATYAEAMQDIGKSEADIVLEIPHDYERDLINGRQPQVLIAANAVNGTQGAMGNAYLSQIVSESVAPSAAAAGKKVSALYLYNKHLNYKVFMIPALMGILMMMLCGFLPALNIVGEKEAGTIEQINVTPVSKWNFILAKLIPYWIIGIVVLTFCLILAWALYGITCQGNLLLVYLMAILMALTFSGIGLIISNYSDTMQQAMFVMWFIVVILMLMSGLFTPVRSMPDWAQKTTAINPMHYFIDAVRTVFVRGGDITSIRFQLVMLTLFAAGMDTWAVRSYRKNSKQ
ncbi:MAG: ABC transporter permease [Prevotella sp.]|nr:ABC transporter permease [Prevotella sp.]